MNHLNSYLQAIALAIIVGGPLGAVGVPWWVTMIVGAMATIANRMINDRRELFSRERRGR